jgi:predicted metalloprotease
MTFRNDVRLDTSEVSDMRGRSRTRTGAIAAGGGGTLTLVVALIVMFLGGGNTTDLLGDLANLESLDPASTAGLEHCKTGADANKYDDCRIVGYVDSIQAYWSSALPAQTGVAYTPVTTVFFSGGYDTGCGYASSASGPFYCPADKHVYIDLGFFKQLQTQFGARGGPFAEGYVIAHEYGHHVQDLQGTLNESSQQEGAQGMSVRIELQADCYAGVWARNAADTGYLNPLTQEQISEALDAAAAVGDDRIQSQMGGGVRPDTWTHGSSEQRVRWFTNGYNGGAISACNTLSGDI